LKGRKCTSCIPARAYGSNKLKTKTIKKTT
jgi:hypothetical protein